MSVGKMHVGIFGGTFNPVHNGHVRAAQIFFDELRLDLLLIIPDNVPPHKDAVTSASPEQRLEMLRLAFADPERNIVVSDCEIARGGVSFTCDTLRSIREKYNAPGTVIDLLVGEDMFLSLDRWKNPEEIFSLARIFTVTKDGPSAECLAKNGEYMKKYGSAAAVLPPTYDETSSSLLRSDPLKMRGRVPETVYEYICENGLYGLPGAYRAEVDRIRSELPRFLTEKRIPHVLGVEKEAVRLAGIFGLGEYDTLRLRAAALLHDITKKFTPEDHAAYLKSVGKEIPEDYALSPKTLHELSGAELALREYPGCVDDGIYRAISLHTTGSPDMTLFDELLFLADYIEETRDFPDCVKLRKLFYGRIGKNPPLIALEDTMLDALDMTVADLIANKKYIHPLTSAARNKVLLSTERRKK